MEEGFVLACSFPGAKRLDADILCEIDCTSPCNLIPTLIWGISLQGKIAVQKQLDSLQTNRS